MHEAQAIFSSAPHRDRLWARHGAGDRLSPPWVAAALLVCLLPIWVSLGDHAVAGRSPSRYARVSVEMAQSGRWLLPTYMGQPHLTKPPLSYWLMAAPMRLGLPMEWSVRLPSALAASAGLLLVFAWGAQVWGRRVGLFAAGMLAVSPLYVIIGRHPLTDGVLGFFWLGTLYCGWASVRGGTDRARLWRAAMWLAVAGGLLTKGPIALLPVGVLVLWRSLAGDWRWWLTPRFGIGLMLACLPLAMWAWLILRVEPQAAHLWWQEVVERAGSDGDHQQPFWYFVPVILLGGLPAAALIPITGFHVSIVQVDRRLRRGDTPALIALAVLLPLLVFSAISGKLATYITPCVPPLTLFAAWFLSLWLQRQPGEVLPKAFKRWPDPRGAWVAAAVSVAVALSGVLVWLLPPASWVLALPGILLAAALILLFWVWTQRVAWRGPALAFCGLSAVLCWLGVAEAEDRLLDAYGPKALIHKVDQYARIESVQWIAWGFNDASLSLYTGHDVPQAESPKMLWQHIAGDRPLLIVAELKDWQRVTRSSTDHQVVEILEPTLFNGREVLVLANDAAEAALNPAAP